MPASTLTLQEKARIMTAVKKMEEVYALPQIQEAFAETEEEKADRAALERDVKEKEKRRKKEEDEIRKRQERERKEKHERHAKARAEAEAVEVPGAPEPPENLRIETRK